MVTLMNTKMLTRTMIATALSAALTACAVPNQQLVRNVSAKHQEHLESTQRNMDRVREDATAETQDSRPHVPWVAVEPITVKPKLPGTFSRKAVLNEPFEAPIGQILSKIQRIIGMDVRIERDVFERPSEAESDTDSASDDLGSDSAGTEILASGMPSLGDNASSFEQITTSFSHTGTTKTLLDSFAANLQADWRYDPTLNRVVIYRYETATFRLPALPGTYSSVTTVGGGASGATTSSTTFDMSNISAWQGIKDTFEGMLSKDGRMAVSESEGMVVVRDLPDVVERATAYMKKVDDSFRQQVTVDVKVYRVNIEDTDTRGINWDAVFETAKHAASMETSRGDITGLSSFVFGISESHPDSNYAGSDLIIDSLSKLGTVTTVTETAVRTTNHQPAPIRNTRKLGYLESSETTVSDGISTTALTAGEVEVGFNLTVVPHVQENGRDLLMQVSMSLSTLNDLVTFDSGTGSVIQLPDVSTRDLMQKIWLRSGESLVMTGLEQVSANNSREGLLHHEVWGAGGRAETGETTEKLVIVITPSITRIGDRS
jgi:type IVB pilus formation R64 PilN family outer membrane protein